MPGIDISSLSLRPKLDVMMIRFTKLQCAVDKKVLHTILIFSSMLAPSRVLPDAAILAAKSSIAIKPSPAESA